MLPQPDHIVALCLSQHPAWLHASDVRPDKALIFPAAPSYLASISAPEQGSAWPWPGPEINIALQVTPEVLYCAKKAGVTHVLKAGGAQAVAAMAWGTETCPKVEPYSFPSLPACCMWSP